MIKIDIGDKFSKWTVIDSVNGKTVMCRCECGKIGFPDIYNLYSGKSKSCGCSRFGPKKKKGYFWHRFGAWTVISIDRKKIGKSYAFFCQCNSCGIKRWIRYHNLWMSAKHGYAKCRYCADKGPVSYKAPKKVVQAIRILKEKDVFSQRKIAKIFNISESLVSRIVNKQRKRWVRD